MLKMDQFIDEKGMFDLKKMREAQAAIGEICSNCWGLLIENLINPPAIPAPKLCVSCDNLANSDEEVMSDTFVRCPKCKEQISGRTFGGDGHYFVKCRKCNNEYEIKTDVHYTFTSPAMEK